MLVIASDLHLNDGSSGETLSAGAFPLFLERLRELAIAASWRADGSYQPIEQIDLLLLGDVLDLVNSRRWLTRPNVRPWGNPQSVEFVDQLIQITKDIFHNNEEALALLRSLSTVSGVTVPPALRAGRPARGHEDGDPIPVRIRYMVGNHDWFLHLPGPSYDALRQMIVDQMGLSNPPGQPFPHDMAENEELLVVLRRHKVAARHGDAYDPMNFEGDRDCSSLGDALAIELIGRFLIEVDSNLAGELPATTLLGLQEMTRVRPPLLIPVWVDGLLERTCPSPALRKRVRTVWDRLADEFLSLDIVRQHGSWGPIDVVDSLQRMLKFSKRLSVHWANSTTQWMNSIRGAASDSYFQHALAEPDFRNRRAKHIVYAHTHLAETIPLDASHAEGYVLNQMYFNTGTWGRVHRPTRSVATEHEFIPADEMTYLAFFQGDERKGRPYETWSGTLGFRPTEITIHRIDPGRGSHAEGQPLSTSKLHDLAPHFSTSPLKARTGPQRRV